MSDTDFQTPNSSRPSGPDTGSRSVVFRLDPEAALRRITWGLASVCAGVALYGLVMLWLGQDYRGLAVWAFVTAAGVYAFAAVVAAVMPRPARDDGIALDGGGFTLTRAGRRDRFDWRDLGDVIVETRSGLARHLFGPAIRVRCSTASPMEAGRRVERVLRIGGGFLAGTDEIVNALERARSRDAGPSVPASSISGTARTVFRPRDHKAERGGVLGGLFGGAVTWLLVFGISSAIGGLFDGWDAFVISWTDPLSERLTITVATLFTFYSLGSDLWKLGLGGSGLSLDRRGLVLTADGRRRRWRWDTVSTIEIQAAPDSGAESTHRIVFIAHHDGISSDGATPSGLRPGAVRTAIDDRYDAPLEAIADLMVSNREAARSEAVIEAGPTEPVPLST